MKLNIWSTVDTESLGSKMIEFGIREFILALDSEVASIDFTLGLIHQLIDSLNFDSTVVVRNTKPVRLDCVNMPTKEDTKYDSQFFPEDTDCCSCGE